MAFDCAAAALLALLAACDWAEAARLTARAWDEAAWLAAWICDDIACPETRCAVGLVEWRAGPAPRGGIVGPMPYP